MSASQAGVADSRSRARPSDAGQPEMASHRILLAGAAPHGAAGNAVSTEVLLAALRRLGPVALVTHRVASLPTVHAGDDFGQEQLTLGVQPFSIHGEALAAGWIHRARLRAWSCAWAVNSRYAGSLRAAGVPYAVWEATTTRDELRSLDLRSIRRGGGSGVGNVVHRALLPIGERIEGWLYRGAAAVLAMSEYTRARMIETHGLDPERVGVLPHPPAPSFLEALRSIPRQPAGDSPSSDGSALRLLFVGRLTDPRKNVTLLLDVIRRLRCDGVPVSLTLIGPYTESWRRTSGVDAMAPHVELRGRVSVTALAEAYRAHDVLVVPSRQEGFGIVVAEAMHAGLPIVSTRCGGPEQALRESMGAAVLVDDGADMAAALRNLAGDPVRRRAMSARGEAYASLALDPALFARRVEVITRDVLTHGRSRAGR